MKIKRYTGTSTREVLARIRNDLGPDAVILSNREIVGGVELMAAVDFDASHLQAEPAAEEPAMASQRPAAAAPRQATPAPSRPQPAPQPVRTPPPAAAAMPAAKPQRPASVQAPAAAAGQGAAGVAQPAWSGEIRGLRDELHALRQWVQSTVSSGAQAAGPVSSPLAERLQELGFSPSCAQALAVPGAKLPDALGAYLQRLDMPADPVAADGVYALVGPTGVGKTTTIAKLAARLVLRHGTSAVALITTDTYRIGGVEQLKIYGRILGVPVAVARDAKELEQHLQEFSDRRFVLIDTIGLSPRDARLAEQMQWLQGFGSRITRLLLINAGMGLGFYDELWKMYQHLPVAACILTKLDETPVFGAALQWLVEQRLALCFYTDGQRVPEDLHVPTLAKIVELLHDDTTAYHASPPAGHEPARANPGF